MSRRPEQPLVDEHADVVVCGASFAGLAVARELAGTGADVLVLDRDEIGAHPTSACAAPMPWLEALGVADSVKQELPCMRFTTPHGSHRVRLPWSWGAFDYSELCRLLWDQADARFERALVKGRVDGGVRTDRGFVKAPLVVDALGWRRVLGNVPFAATRRSALAGARGSSERRWRRARRRHRPLARPPRLLLARARRRRGARRCGRVRPARRRQAADCRGRRAFRRPAGPPPGEPDPASAAAGRRERSFFVGDSAGHCFALSAEGIRGAFYFGIACGRELRSVLAGDATVGQALASYSAFSARHRSGFWITYLLQRVIPELPPRALTVVIRALSGRRLVDAIFNWYLGLLPVPPYSSDSYSPGPKVRTSAPLSSARTT